jgi:hypothetical protein
MQFSSKEDIEAPADAVFAMLSEFERFERMAVRRGVEVERLQDPGAPAVGMAWHALFRLRGKPRDAQITLDFYEPPEAMRFVTRAKGVEGFLELELVALSPRRTRMAVILNLKPRTISGRLLIQSLKLTKANLTKRFKLKVADYAKGLEDRHHRIA